MTVKAWYDGPKWFKASKKSFVGDTDHHTDKNSNPANTVYFNLMLWPFNPTETCPQQNAHVEIVQYVVWRDPADHGGS